MSNMLPGFPSTDKGVKSFWERPEGVTGMIFLAILGSAAVFVGGPFLIAGFNILITLLGQAWAITAMGGGLAVLLMIVTNRRVHTLTKVMFQEAMRWFTGLIVEINPIGIMRSYIEDLAKKRGVIDDSIKNLDGQAVVCEKQIDKNKNAYEAEMKKAKYAKDNNIQDAYVTASRQAMRLSELNEKRLIPLHNQMVGHLKMLRKFRSATDVIMIDLQNEVDVREQERKMILSSWSAMNAAKKIINGGHDERALFDQALEFTANDYCMKMGEIEHFLESTQGFMQSIDVQNGMHDNSFLEHFAAWEAKADQLMISHSPSASIDFSNVKQAIKVAR